MPLHHKPEEKPIADDAGNGKSAAANLRAGARARFLDDMNALKELRKRVEDRAEHIAKVKNAWAASGHGRQLTDEEALEIESDDPHLTSGSFTKSNRAIDQVQSQERSDAGSTSSSSSRNVPKTGRKSKRQFSLDDIDSEEDPDAKRRKRNAGSER